MHTCNINEQSASQGNGYYSATPTQRKYRTCCKLCTTLSEDYINNARLVIRRNKKALRDNLIMHTPTVEETATGKHQRYG